MNPFLAAQAADPYNPAPMLILADWYEERGDITAADVLRGLVAAGIPTLAILALAVGSDSPSGYFGPNDVFDQVSGCGEGTADCFGYRVGCGDGNQEGFSSGEGIGDGEPTARGEGGGEPFESNGGGDGEGETFGSALAPG